MKKLNGELFEKFQDAVITTNTSAMIQGGITSNDCTNNGKDCGDKGSVYAGSFNGDNFVTSIDFDSAGIVKERMNNF
jgi:hypothetical protein